MPTIVPAADIIVAGDGIILGGISDTLYVMEDIDIVSTGANGARLFSDNNAQVHGSVHGELNGILMGEEVPGGEVYVGDTGNVSASQASAIRGTFAGDGNSGRYSLTNDGDISSHGRIATVHFEANPAPPPGTTFFGGDFAIVNNGIIASVHYGPGPAAIRLLHTGFLSQIFNAEDGVISAVGDESAAIEVLGRSFGGPDGQERISEHRLVNDGEIYGEWYSYRSVDRGNDWIWNTGIMHGEVRLGVDNDRYFGQGGEMNGIVYGGDGDDVLVGGALDETLNGGFGRDVIRGGGGSDDLDGGGLDDRMFGGEGADHIFTGGGNDFARGGAGADVLFGGGGLGRDHLIGGWGQDDIHGLAGDDLLRGGADADVVFGGGGRDDIHGGGGDDRLDGGTLNDIINGGRGNDELSGGAGADIFRFRHDSGHDVVRDYADGVDRFDVSLLPFTGFGDLVLTQTGADVVIDLSFGALEQTITVIGEVVASFDPGDFIF